MEGFTVKCYPSLMIICSLKNSDSRHLLINKTLQNAYPDYAPCFKINIAELCLQFMVP